MRVVAAVWGVVEERDPLLHAVKNKNASYGLVGLRKTDVRGCGVDWLCIPPSEVFDPRRSSFRRLRIRAWHANGLELSLVFLAVPVLNP